MSDLQTAMDAIGQANKEHGVTQKGGKRYTMVQDRVLEWRKVFGLKHGIETLILKDDGNIVQVQATIKNEQGRIIGSGLAEERRGSSNVNKTSALENCETSAVGRALASLGLHGGEYASANELDKVKRLSEKPTPAQSQSGGTDKVPAPSKVSDQIPLTSDEARNDWESWVTEQIAGMQTHKNMAEHRRWSITVKAFREQLQAENSVLHQKLLTAYINRKEMLERGVAHAQ